MKTRPRTRILVVLTLLVISAIVVLCLPKQQKIEHSGLHLTLPFVVRESDETANGIVYRNKKFYSNLHQDSIEVIVGAVELTEEEWYAMKTDFSDFSDLYRTLDMYGTIKNNYKNYELIYRYTDAGPETYVIIIHSFSLNNYYRVVTKGLDKTSLICLIDSITFDE